MIGGRLATGSRRAPVQANPWLPYGIFEAFLATAEGRGSRYHLSGPRTYGEGQRWDHPYDEPFVRPVAGQAPRDAVTTKQSRLRQRGGQELVARPGGKRRQLQFVRPARAVLRVQIPVRLRDLHRIDDQVAAVLVARQLAAARRVDRTVDDDVGDVHAVFRIFLGQDLRQSAHQDPGIVERLSGHALLAA